MDEITARISEITEEAGNRMRLASYSPHQIYAEIMFMTDAEVAEIHRLKLKLKLKLNGDSSVCARNRIADRITMRRLLKKNEVSDAIKN